ncbi:hypothetical protein QQP08_008765 [Theobroma cacao]|nr:hypothetical protein QQP08_008765 [Theobroma cacao]
MEYYKVMQQKWCRRIKSTFELQNIKNCMQFITLSVQPSNPGLPFHIVPSLCLMDVVAIFKLSFSKSNVEETLGLNFPRILMVDFQYH